MRFKVDKLWKGDFGDEVIMSTGVKERRDGLYDLPASCDYEFQLGEKYVVFAFGASPETMKARKCAGTRLLKYAEKEIDNLDAAWPHKRMNREPKAGNKKPT